MTTSFQSLVVRRQDGVLTHAIEACQPDDLPDGDLLVRVHYSSLNYKDCLSFIGNPGVTRRFPHTPGIDAAGIVEWSRDSAFPVGTPVVVVSHEFGMNVRGGLSEYIRVPAKWAMPLPAGMTLYESMIYGTAGYTAALAVEALQHDSILPGTGEVVVTGATGGVGSLAVAMLSQLDYRVVASTGKTDLEPLLRSLGATAVVSRQAVSDTTGRNLLPSRWAAAVDTVGGDTLSTLVRSVETGGTIVVTGMVASQELHLTVLPFILRGVRLAGICAQETPPSQRERVWNRMATDLKPAGLALLATTIGLDAVPDAMMRMLEGKHSGRVVVDLR